MSAAEWLTLLQRAQTADEERQQAQQQVEFLSHQNSLLQQQLAEKTQLEKQPAIISMRKTITEMMEKLETQQQCLQQIYKTFEVPPPEHYKADAVKHFLEGQLRTRPPQQEHSLQHYQQQLRKLENHLESKQRDNITLSKQLKEQQHLLRTTSMQIKDEQTSMTEIRQQLTEEKEANLSLKRELESERKALASLAQQPKTKYSQEQELQAQQSEYDSAIKQLEQQRDEQLLIITSLQQQIDILEQKVAASGWLSDTSFSDSLYSPKVAIGQLSPKVLPERKKRKRRKKPSGLDY